MEELYERKKIDQNSKKIWRKFLEEIIVEQNL